MVKRLKQQSFRVEPFDSNSFNLHIGHDGRSVVVVAIHGLGGRGYRTWGSLLAALFDGTEGISVDLGVYDYVSAHRRLCEASTSPSFWVQQLSGHIRQLAADYDHVFLLGHSLGGVLCEKVVMALLRADAMSGDAGSSVSPTATLAGLVLVASPRAGTGAAFVPLRWIWPETRLLKRLHKELAEVDDFFSSSIERLNVSSATPGKCVLATYAAVAGSDSLVSGFSAAFGVPVSQRKHLSAGHRTVVRPPLADDQALLRWLQQIIVERVEVRTQSERERQHAASRLGVPKEPFREGIVTAFHSDAGGTGWELLYNEARGAASSPATAVLDVRDVPGGRPDLLIAIHDSELVTQQSPGPQRIIELACERRAAWPAAVLGVAPVGPDFLPAQAGLRAAVATLGHTSVYVEGAPGEEGLRVVLDRWLQIVLSRDPRRRRAFDQPSGVADEDLRMGGA